MRCKADDEVGLAPVEEGNAAARKIGRKGGVVFWVIDYNYASPAD